MTTTHVLRLKWTTSRGQDTYGWNICTLVDETTGQRYRTTGGGYDMAGAVFGDWLQETAQARLRALPTLDYGARRHESGNVTLDGACGLSSMLRLAEAVGADVTRTHDRKGNTTGWLVRFPLDEPCDGCGADPGEECRPGCLSIVTREEGQS